MSARTATLDRLITTKEIMIFCGSGGVGKTSIAAATGLGAACKTRTKVLVLTIDPARRLADALGIPGIGNDAVRVAPDVLERAGLSPKGELWVAMLDTKQSWDALINRHAPDQATAERILSNPMYHNITSRFVQSHDYIAMERLHELHAAGDYDLIVLDTPPTRHAIDFLEAPERMAEFFGGRLIRLLTAPYRVGGKRTSRLLNVASRPFYQVADRVLGSQLLQDLAEFLLNFQTMYDGFVKRADAVAALLHDRRTSFTVVSTLEPAPLAEAEYFAEALRERHFDYSAIVMNKALPDMMRDPKAAAVAQTWYKTPDAPVATLQENGVLTDVDDVRLGRVLAAAGEAFLNYEVVATREHDLAANLRDAPDIVVSVPLLPADVHDLGGLAHIARTVSTFD
ncbi:MAG: ArsA family ATPase [Actinobacteria bacterium]|nr:ArsA family ATPase [Actinomycetota bacterium]MCB9389196.1 ArsA family ATPase [Acidimicrobiia bacterium]